MIFQCTRVKFWIFHKKKNEKLSTLKICYFVIVVIFWPDIIQIIILFCYLSRTLFTVFCSVLILFKWVLEIKLIFFFFSSSQNNVLYSQFMFVPAGPFVFCHGVHQWWRSDVPNTAVWQIQGTRRRVSVYFRIDRTRLQKKSSFRKYSSSKKRSYRFKRIIFQTKSKHIESSESLRVRRRKKKPTLYDVLEFFSANSYLLSDNYCELMIQVCDSRIFFFFNYSDWLWL